MNKIKVGLISLGCDKNKVESEYMLNIIAKEHQLVNDVSDADVVVINTCAFIESAVKEGIDTIMSVAQYGVKIIVTGCLPMRYRKTDFLELMPEVSAFLDNQHYTEIAQVVYNVYEGERESLKNQGLKSPMCGERLLSSNSSYAYLRIADGCDNCCSYCAIPKIRGGYRAVDKWDLVKEARYLVDNFGTRELILVAQDVSRYKTGSDDLHSLLDELEKTSVEKIRLMYCYPEAIDERLVLRLAQDSKLIPYLDMPLQHIDNRILSLMNRKCTTEEIYEKLELLKRYDITLRSTFIAGFPSETEDEFKKLLSFIEAGNIDYAGFFPYFREEGTVAYSLDGQLPKSVKNKRALALEKAQSYVTREKQKQLLNTTQQVTFDYIDYEKNQFVGHTDRNHPEVDTKVFFKADFPVEQGERYSVKIKRLHGLDLVGECV